MRCEGKNKNNKLKTIKVMTRSGENTEKGRNGEDME